MQQKLQKLALSLVDIGDGPNKHFSFIVRKREIISIGWNSYVKTHPEAIKWGFPFRYRHSELHAIIKFPDKIGEIRKCQLYNVRVNRLGEVGMSRPCRYCLPMVLDFGFKKIHYTNGEGEWISV